MKADEGKVERKAGLRVGYVPQRLTVDWTMPLTVRRLMTLTAPLPASEVEVALDAVGIAHLAGAEVQHLSGWRISTGTSRPRHGPQTGYSGAGRTGSRGGLLR